MSAVSLKHVRDEIIDAEFARRLLGDVAVSTILDPELNRAVLSRPHCVTALSMQVKFIVLCAARCKATVSAPDVAARNSAWTAAGTTLQTTVAVIGLGSVGTSVVDNLLRSTGIDPTAIAIITRHGSFPSRFAEVGVKAYKSFEEAVPTADIVVICCQPGQLAAVAASVKEAGGLKPSAILVSVCTSVSPDKVAAEFGHVCCVSCAIDAARIADLSMKWLREDEAAERRRREITATSIHAAPDSSNDAHPDRRADELRASAGFAEIAEACCRTLHALSHSLSARGARFSNALNIAARVLFGVPFNFPDEQPPPSLLAVCTVEQVATAAGLTEAALLQHFRNSFIGTV